MTAKPHVDSERVTGGPRTAEEPSRLLVVDDAVANLKSLGALLEAPGIEVATARSGAEALRYLLDHDVACVLLDVQMPGLDGFQTAELIRSRDRNLQTPILFVTGYLPGDSDLARGYACGAVDYLVKPINPDVLRAKVGTFVELDRRRRREERGRAELLRSNADLARFAQATAHDLQSPLRGLTEGLKALESRLADRLNAGERELVSTALGDTDRMRRLIRALLAYASVRTQEPVPETVESGTILDDALLALRAPIASSKAEITRGTLPVVLADPVRLRQVFQNLVENAIRFSGDGAPKIHVTCVREGSEWQFAVRDEGLGIAPQDHERVFEPFRRLKPRGDSDGSGLGLAICREAVERHGGRIWVESELGRGATFRFTLPAVAPATPASQA